jgi:hypothetical protein
MPDNVKTAIDFENIIIDKNDCINYGGIWSIPHLNFDNLGSSLQTLFIVCTLEGWLDFMHQAVDAVGIDM